MKKELDVRFESEMSICQFCKDKIYLTHIACEVCNTTLRLKYILDRLIKDDIISVSRARELMGFKTVNEMRDFLFK